MTDTLAAMSSGTEAATARPHSPAPVRGADSEVGRLRTVMLHRPGPELKRLTPRNNDKLLFDGIPWVHRAQDEHDAFAAELRSRGVEVLYLTELLTETLSVEDARAAELHVVAVAPDRQGSGLGRVVVTEALRLLAGHGWPRALLYVDADNTAARALYARTGFRPGHVDRCYELQVAGR